MSWDERYSGDEFVYGKEANGFLKECLEFIPKGGKVLCLAEGEGRNAIYLAQSGFEVHAVDLSSVGREKALKWANEHGLELHYEVADLAHYDFGVELWDAVISIWAHVPSELQKILSDKIVHGLRQNGVLILEGYNKKQLEYGTGGPKNEDMLYDLNRLRDQYSKLEIIRAEDRVRFVSEGLLHNGESSVTQFIGKKA